MAIQTAFEASPDSGSERVTLVTSTPSRMPFSKPTRTIAPFDDWAMTAPDAARGAVARIFQAWADNEQDADGNPFVVPETNAARLHPALVASLAEPEALALGLPPVARLSLNIQSIGIGQTRDVHVYLPQSVHPDPAIGPMSFDLKLDALMRRKRDLSRGLLLPGENEGDASSLFDAVLGEAEEPADIAAPVQEVPADLATSVAPEPVPKAAPLRPTLSSRPAEPAPAAPSINYPSRVAFQPSGRRTFEIFEKPVADRPVAELSIRDPYGCADGRNRQCLVDFMTMIVRAARQVSEITVVSFDADSVDRYANESSLQQYDDLQQRWRRVMPGGPSLRLIQLSRRQSRSFHDRSVKARSVTGTEIIWDLSNGIDGVMMPSKDCTVHVTVT